MRVTVFYPFTNLDHVGWGNSLRAKLMVRYLAEHGCETWVLSPARKNLDIWNGAVRHVTFRWSVFDRLRARVKATWAQAQGGPFSAGNARLIHAFGNTRGNRAFRARALQLLRDSSIAFLEYPMWASSLIPLCKLNAIPNVLTAYDIHSNTLSTHSALQAELLNLELAALRAADFAFCVSAADQQLLHNYGIQAGLVPNPIDISQCYVDTDPQVIDSFRYRHQLDVRPICAFVGSSHVPNIEAAKALDRLAPQCPEVQLVVAGLCAPRDLQSPVRKLGMVSPQDLRTLYTISQIILIPLTGGTGTSLKTIEAFAFGKPILATTIAVRGYEVISGQHALIEDNLSGYPSLIRAMLANSPQLAALSAQAQTLAKLYDYRKVFQAYDFILESGWARERLDIENTSRDGRSAIKHRFF